MSSRTPYVFGLVVFLLNLGNASAYPHFQHSFGTAQCGTCHQAPTGMGLLTDYGRQEAGETLSLGGDGRFLHGWVNLPAWLSFGGALRVAGLANDTAASGGLELAAFPMQADLTARVGTESLAVVATVGARGRARGDTLRPESDLPRPSVSPLVSREHYAYWSPGTLGTYVRAGRFFVPYGLRVADHTTYVRRYLGTNVLEESYGLGGGYVADNWELHLTGFVADPWLKPALPENGGAALAEWHLEGLTIGASVRAGFGPGRMRTMTGVLTRWWWPSAKVTWMAELDAIVRDFQANAPNQMQIAAYVGPVWNPMRGLYTGAAYELFDEDVRFNAVKRHALAAWVSFFPWAHFEVMATTRAQLSGASNRAFLAMLQLHYYL